MSGHFGLNLGLVQRSKGQTAVERSAYQRRGAARLADGSVVNYSDRGDHVAHFVLAPDGAPAWATDCKQLWIKAAAAEKRADAQEARLLELSLPRALTREDWIALARRVARVLVKRGMVVQVDIHNPLASDGQPNPHAHLMITMREIKDGKFAEKKARHWNKEFYGKAALIRRDMAEVLNRYCRERGVDYQADPRSNAERGLPPAEVRLPRWNVLHYKRTGQKTRALEQRDRERAAKAKIARLQAECQEIERELALTYAEAQRFTSASRPMNSASLGVITAQARLSVSPETAPASSAPVDVEPIDPRYGP